LRIFKIRWFDRFARKEGIDDRDLCAAVARAEQGAIDADLGGGLIKQRVARKGAGKRGGYRTIFAYRAGERAVFLYGFAKSARDNVRPDELQGFRRLGADALAQSDRTIGELIADGKWMEVHNGREEEDV
jgi:hypothetical protein